MTYRLTMPWPPSINHYWRMFIMGKSPRMILSKEGREYREATALMWRAAGHSKLRGRFRVEFTAFMPDRRDRDLDNLLKALNDALQHSGAFDDDSMIDALSITRGPIDKFNPRVECVVTIIKPEFQPSLQPTS